MKDNHPARDSSVCAFADELAALDREVGRHILPPGEGIDLRPHPEEDPLIKQLMEDERAFLNPEEWGVDLRPVFCEQLEAPASPDALSDREVSGYLRWMVLILAQHHLCLVQTNHLSDRELYRHIMEEIIPRPIGVGPNPIGGLLYHECCPCDDSDLWLRYYADADERRQWQEETGEPLPDKAPLVSDRDLWIEMLAECHRDQPLPVFDGDDAHRDSSCAEIPI